MKHAERLAFVAAGGIAGCILVVTSHLASPRPAFGQAAPGGDSGWLMATGNLSGGGSVCFLYDTKSGKLGAYTVKSTQLQLLAIRLCTYDYHAIQFPNNQDPSVADMKRASEDHGRKAKQLR